MIDGDGDDGLCLEYDSNKMASLPFEIVGGLKALD